MNGFAEPCNRIINREKKILITGAAGLVGIALAHELKNQGYTNLVLLTRQLCNLVDFEAVKAFFLKAKPDVVFHAAASVYGLGGNLKKPASIFLDNTLMNTHVIEASRLAGVQKVIAMGTIAVYPDLQTNPVRESNIWEGPPSGSESSYGHSKRAMLAQLLAYHQNYGLDYAYVLSTNLYGPNDRFDSQFGHVIPSMVFKFYQAKNNHSDVVLWGDGTAARDFLYSKDMAQALVLIMNQYTGAINVASGKKTMIKEVAHLLAKLFEMDGRIQWDVQMPNGRRFYEVDLTRLKSIGFQPVYTIEKGLRETIEWFRIHHEQNLTRC
ncbi:MAG TPA: NAD-dependent epimerase/dehydratase family protein [Chlamydiales bacterium]|nr:NAD-dependent epimerase/dehydratase family protein [Chlamydiales bacterium]